MDECKKCEYHVPNRGGDFCNFPKELYMEGELHMRNPRIKTPHERLTDMDPVPPELWDLIPDEFGNKEWEMYVARPKWCRAEFRLTGQNRAGAQYGYGPLGTFPVTLIVTLLE